MIEQQVTALCIMSEIITSFLFIPLEHPVDIPQ